ncbi:LysR family transcriptional regulator [Piscinibacter sakaiensis]|uniref:HTH lysR-type domain-containing protein n=1 Tax=Piscinibacter sakaiensis TaxID=1547922 RepID=A0A0K8P909_PISS1|nr:LysR family transcriptional regulator [Piscinibacter sakaiensis]GAP39004.1 hypothetical protein ISF6_0423 [Piscinibacter sakaiensis]
MPRPADLDSLQVFAAVAEAGGFTAAAARLGRTKAAVSLAVRQLEARLGVPLFVRTTRQVRPTEAGQRLHAECRPALDTLREALARAASPQATLEGTLRLTAPVTHAAGRLADVIAAFAERHPGVRVELHTADRMLDLVAEGLDLGLRMGQLRDSTLRATRLGEFEQVPVAAPGYLARHGLPRTPSELAGHAWIALSLLRTPLTWTFTARDGRRESVRLRARLQVNGSSSLLALLERGAGLSVLDGPSVAQALADGRLVRLLPGWSLPRGGIYAVFPPGRHLDPRVRAFVALYRAMVGRDGVGTPAAGAA